MDVFQGRRRWRPVNDRICTGEGLSPGALTVVGVHISPPGIHRRVLINIGFGRRGVTLVSAIGRPRRQNSLITIAPWLLPRRRGRGGAQTCLRSCRYWASRL